MQQPPVPIDETQRLMALHQLKVLDTGPEERFDRFTRLAARLFGVPIALVSLVDRDRQWFKSRQGLGATETGRDISFCGHAILGDEPLVVPDSLSDPRFADNPLVTGAPGIRFYAGQPLHAPDGARVGTLCIIDRSPKELSASDRALLADVASMVEREFALLALATTDELTRVSNRRGLGEIAAHVLPLCRRHAAPAALAVVDLDGFKAINDTHGHAAGDDVLRRFARLLVREFRTSDVVARLGGDEFCVFAGGTSEPQLAAAMMRFASVAAASDLARDYPGVAWSVGVAGTTAGDAATLDALLEHADARMYRSKRGAARDAGAAG